MNALRVHPDHLNLRVKRQIALAQILKDREEYEGAIAALEDAVEDAPTDPDVLRRLGDAYLTAQRIDEAETVFRKLVQTNPNDDGARTLLTRVLAIKGGFG